MKDRRYGLDRCRRIIAWQIDEAWAFPGALEVDESYFGRRRKEK